MPVSECRMELITYHYLLCHRTFVSYENNHNDLCAYCSCSFQDYLFYASSNLQQIKSKN